MVISKRDKEITERNSADWIIAGPIYSKKNGNHSN
jgi:hypothetical protein